MKKTACGGASPELLFIHVASVTSDARTFRARTLYLEEPPAGDGDKRSTTACPHVTSKDIVLKGNRYESSRIDPRRNFGSLCSWGALAIGAPCRFGFFKRVRNRQSSSQQQATEDEQVSEHMQCDGNLV